MIGQILNDTKAGDLILVSEISRLGRSTLQILKILELVTTKKVAVHITKNNNIMDDSMQATITATILGLVARIERKFIFSRTREVLAKCKTEGIKLGRPKAKPNSLNSTTIVTKYLSTAGRASTNVPSPNLSNVLLPLYTNG